MIAAREELLDALRAAIAEVSPGHPLAAAFETPRQAEHGDLAVTAAMPLAKAQKRNPRDVAAELIAALRANGGEPVLVEFVSANPTGPLHVGHARQAALGDAICNLLETQGRRVVREF